MFKTKRIAHGVIALGAIALFLLSASPAMAQKPTLVRDTDNPAQQPVTYSGFLTVQPGVTDSATVNFLGPAVPAGKRLIVETISYGATVVATGTMAINVFATTNGSSMSVLLPLNAATKYGGSQGSDYLGSSIALRLYADAGTSLQLQVSRFGPVNGIASAAVSVSGYFVIVP